MPGYFPLDTDSTCLTKRVMNDMLEVEESAIANCLHLLLGSVCKFLMQLTERNVEKEQN